MSDNRPYEGVSARRGETNCEILFGSNTPEAPIFEADACREIVERVDHLIKVESSLLGVMMSARCIPQKRPESKDLSRLQTTPEFAAFRERAVLLLRRTGEIQHLLQRCLFLFERMLSESSEWESEQGHQQYIYLKGCYDRLQEESSPKDRMRLCVALENPEWDFRTVEGLAHETGLPQAKVEEILEQNPDIFRRSSATDRMGRALFTLASRPVRWKERLALLQSALKEC